MPAEEADPPYTVETFEYPNAAKILKEQGIALHKGDGHILLADCKISTDIQVFTRHNKEGRYCFKVTGTGKTGYLSLEIPQAFNVTTGDYAVRASVTADGKTSIVDIPKNDVRAIGEGTNPPGSPASLVELRVTG
ncbi:hypothetical protein [Streptomyces hesseae]|uniref:Uncharacterized protein n=1 Tax=Streptomyces hesseae TaxID=3075519 RepID=A0ABU2SYX8_9ACTN|nr:hypothetical protein [Streptomyces sp. DSM 40473]MDT0453796.1 hypothetical protein [Streptomyces sp. DSM 40473]